MSLWKGILKFFTIGFYRVLRVVNTLQIVLDIKRPLLMWCFSPLQALASRYSLAMAESQIACRKTACAGGSICVS